MPPPGARRVCAVALREYGGNRRQSSLTLLISVVGVAPREHQSGQPVCGRTRMPEVDRSQQSLLYARVGYATLQPGDQGNEAAATQIRQE